MPELDKEVNSNKSSVEHEPSRTAMAAAKLRALAAAEPAVRGPDTLAEIFLTEDRRRALKDPAARKRALSGSTIPGMYEFMIARTAFFDALVERAFREGTPQVVFLGAGYDTRPYRFRGLIGGTRIFELDAGPTQQRKIEILRNSGIPVPPGLSFVPVNFNTDIFTDNLARSGFDRNRETLFIWEGVTYYLPAAAVDLTLKLIRSCSPAGSSVCFDYSCYSPEELEHENVKKLRAVMRSRYSGEPVTFWIKAGGTEEFLAARGYDLREHLTAEDMKMRYLDFPGAPSGKIPGLFRLACAAVCAS